MLLRQPEICCVPACQILQSIYIETDLMTALTFYQDYSTCLPLLEPTLAHSHHQTHFFLTLSQTTNIRLIRTERVCRQQFQI